MHLALLTSGKYVIYFSFSSGSSDDEDWDVGTLFPDAVVEENLKRICKHRRTIITSKDKTSKDANTNVDANACPR